RRYAIPTRLGRDRGARGAKGKSKGKRQNSKCLCYVRSAPSDFLTGTTHLGRCAPRPTGRKYLFSNSSPRFNMRARLCHGQDLVESFRTLPKLVRIVGVMTVSRSEKAAIPDLSERRHDVLPIDVSLQQSGRPGLFGFRRYLAV